jgi:hypothetical protein
MKTSICLIFTNAKTKLVEQHGWKMLLKLTFLFQACFIIAGVNASFAQNGGAISTTPNVSSGCPTTQVKYTFSYSGSGILRGREWSLSPSSAGTFPESNSGSSITVTWNSSGSVVVNFAVQQGSQINSYSVPMSFSVTPASAGTITGPSSVCYGGGGSFSISGNSSAVTWQRCTTGCSTNTDAGWTTTTNSFTNLTAATQFRAKLNDIACGVKYSNVITTTVSPVFYPGTIQGGGEYCSDQSITLSSSNAAGGGNGIIEYQWQQNRGSGFININAAGANQASYIVPAGQLASSYQRLAKDGVCQTSFVASNILLVSTPPALNANTLSAPTSICSGTSPGLITGGVPTGGRGGYQYTWQQSLDGITWSLGVGVNGTTTVTSSSYDPPETLSSRMYYQRTVTSACGLSAKSFTYIDVQSPSVGTATGPASVCYNAGGSFSISGNSSAVTWQRCSKGTGCLNDTEWINMVGNSFTNLRVSTEFRAKINNLICGAKYSTIIKTNVINPSLSGSLNRPAISSGSTFSYQPTSATTGSTFAWSRAAITGIVGAASSGVGSINERLVNSTKTDITVVYVFLTSSGGCTGVAQQVSVLVKGALFPNENYIISNTLLTEGVTNENLVNTMPVSQRNQTIQYFDGLGRPMQTVNREASPSQQDMVQSMVFDSFGRENKKYLPVVINTKDGWYKSNLIDPTTGSYTNQALNFYNNTDDKIADDPRPYSETIFEASPLNRPDKDYGVGQAWAPEALGGNNKFLQHSYQVNQHGTGSSATQEKVIAWAINNSGELVRAGVTTEYVMAGGYYASGQLTIKSTKDEEGNEVREYTNKEGRVILKKVQATTTGATNLNDSNGWALTYYVYDYLGNLAIVLPPEAVKILEN